MPVDVIMGAGAGAGQTSRDGRRTAVDPRAQRCRPAPAAGGRGPGRDRSRVRDRRGRGRDGRRRGRAADPDHHAAVRGRRKTAGSLCLVVSLPTMLVAFARYSRDQAFGVLRGAAAHRRSPGTSRYRSSSWLSVARVRGLRRSSTWLSRRVRALSASLSAPGPGGTRSVSISCLPVSGSTPA